MAKTLPFWQIRPEFNSHLARWQLYSCKIQGRKVFTWQPFLLKKSGCWASSSSLWLSVHCGKVSAPRLTSGWSSLQAILDQLQGFQGVNGTKIHLVPPKYTWGRPLESLKLVSNLPRDVGGDVGPCFHSVQRREIVAVCFFTECEPPVPGSIAWVSGCKWDQNTSGSIMYHLNTRGEDTLSPWNSSQTLRVMSVYVSIVQRREIVAVCFFTECEPRVPGAGRAGHWPHQGQGHWHPSFPPEHRGDPGRGQCSDQWEASILAIGQSEASTQWPTLAVVRAHTQLSQCCCFCKQETNMF